MLRTSAAVSQVAARLHARIAHQAATRTGLTARHAAAAIRPAHQSRLFSTAPPSSSGSGSGGAASTAEDDAEFEKMMGDIQARMQMGGGGGAADGKAPNIEELMKQMEAMGIKMDGTGLGAADAANGVGAAAGEGAAFSEDPAAAAAAARDAATAARFDVKSAGTSETLTFQTETKRMLDIMANSLYTDHEVFLRELISNASDALEKLRFLRTASPTGENDTVQSTRELAIRIHTNESQNLLVIEDNGIGMTADELKSHLGVIARSGSKAFIKEAADAGAAKDTSNIIGQFGVGFYSVFMVADRIDVISQSSKKDPATGKAYPAHLWSSDGSGTYTLTPIESTGETGTTLKIHLKKQFKEFAQQHTLAGVVQKYSNFVGFPIELNGEKVNTVGAVWLDAKDKVTPEQHQAFYRYVSSAYDTPTYTLHFHVDAPLALHGLFYFPERHMEKYGMGRMEPGASLYSRKVLIKSKSKDILPEWLRFVKGVADSEDIPLNISRENMQDSRLIQKISNILVRKIIKFLEDEAKADPAKYNKWYEEFGNFLKEGVCTEYRLSSDIARLLRFETSATKPGETVSLDEYISRMQPDQKGIFYLSTPSRDFARTSPYYESFASKQVEVLFLYHNIDEFVMNSLQKYNKRNLVSIEKADAHTEAGVSDGEKGADGKDKAAPVVDASTADTIAYMTSVLGDKVSSISVTTRLVNSPAAIFDHESGAVRRLMKFVDTQGVVQKGLAKQKLEINPAHPLIKNLLPVSQKQPAVAKLIVEQLFDNCLIAADMLDQPRSMLDRLNKILEQTSQSVSQSVQEAEITPKA